MERKEVLRRFKKDDPVDAEIQAVLRKMDAIGVAAEEYPKMLTYLERLHKIKVANRPDLLSRDTIAIVVGSFLEVAMIISHERAHVITSKALNRTVRPKN